jgi:hypothetical protein
MQDVPRPRNWNILGPTFGGTAIEAALGYLLLRYVFHASLWWLLALFPLPAFGLWAFWRPASVQRFLKKLEMSPNYPRDFFP